MLLFDSRGRPAHDNSISFQSEASRLQEETVQESYNMLKGNANILWLWAPFHDDSISFQSEASGLPETILQGFQSILEENAMIQ